MYRQTEKKARIDRICARMRAGKTALQQLLAAELGRRAGPFAPPRLRRVVIVIDYDFGVKIDVFRLLRSNRIDSYHAVHNGRPVDGRIGWANFCKRLSTHFPRIGSSL